MNLGPILAIAGTTIRETARRRLLLALVVLTVIVIGGSYWGFGKLWDISSSGDRTTDTVTVRTVASQMLILVAFMFAAVLALTAAIVAAPSISGEVESGQALAVLARPIRRSDVVLGKWLGLAAVLGVYSFASVWAEVGSVYLATGYEPPHPWLLNLFVAGVGLSLLTLTIAISTRVPGITGAFVALAAYFVAWVGGIVGGVGQALDNQALATAGTASRLLLPTDGLWRGAVWSLEPATILAANRAAGARIAAIPFAASEPPPLGYELWCAGWVILVLAIALWSFHSRQL